MLISYRIIQLNNIYCTSTAISTWIHCRFADAFYKHFYSTCTDVLLQLITQFIPQQGTLTLY